jgi:hypothetical protein
MIPALIFGVYMKTDWGISLFFLVPLALVAIPALRLRQRALVALLTMWLAVTLIMLVAAPTIAAKTTREEGPPGTTFAPNSEFAAQLTQAWRARFGSRWAVVAGTTELGEPMTFYSPDHPAPLTPGEVWSSGLTSLEEAERMGFIGICDTGDSRIHDCEIWMGQHAANGERLDLETRRMYHGKPAGPVVKWKAWIVRQPRQ